MILGVWLPVSGKNIKILFFFSFFSPCVCFYILGFEFLIIFSDTFHEVKSKRDKKKEVSYIADSLKSYSFQMMSSFFFVLFSLWSDQRSSRVLDT